MTQDEAAEIGHMIRALERASPHLLIVHSSSTWKVQPWGDPAALHGVFERPSLYDALAAALAATVSCDHS